MPDTQGKVASLQIRQMPLPSGVLDAYVTLASRPPLGIGPTFTLWSAPVNECIPATTSVVRSLNVSLLRQALADELNVVISHTDPIIVVDPQGGELQVSYVEAVKLLV